MEKMLKKLKVIVAILLVILLSLIAFWGVFIKEKGVWNNRMAPYNLGMDIKGSRELRYALDNSEEEKYVYVDENGNIMGEVWENGSSTTAEHEAEHEAGTAEDEANHDENEEVPYAKETRTIKINRDENLTKENFEQAKKLIQKRLKKQGISEYNIRLDNVTGSLIIETPNKEAQVDKVQDIVSTIGKFQMVDYQNGLVLMDNSDIKKVSVVTSNDGGYTTYLQIEFNKEGSEKLRKISTDYKETIAENTQNEESGNEESAEEQTQETEKRYVSIVLDDTTMMTTYFGEEMTAGVLQIAVGQAKTDYQEYLEDYNSAKTISDMLNSGMLPISYELEADNFVQAEIVNEADTMKLIAVITIILISIIFIVKFKMAGLFASPLGIGYIALLSIVVRYTNAVITESSIVVYAVAILLNYIFMKKLLLTGDVSKNYDQVQKRFFLKLIPVCVVAVVFTLSQYFVVSSIGMAMFWGIILSILYNFIITRTVLKNGEEV